MSEDNLVVLSQTKLTHMRNELRGRGITWLLDLFLKELPNYINELNAAIASGSGEALYLAAHKFKGSCSNVGAERMVALCKRLETLGHANELKQATTLMTHEVAEQIKQLQEAMENEKRKEK